MSITIILDSDILSSFLNGDCNLLNFYGIKIEALKARGAGENFYVSVSGDKLDLENFLFELGYENHRVEEILG
jgi:hypothetical protein